MEFLFQLNDMGLADSDPHHLQKQHRKHKLPVIGGMSMAEGIYLGAQVWLAPTPVKKFDEYEFA